MRRRRLNWNSESHCMKSDQVKMTQNIENPASPVLSNQFLLSINFLWNPTSSAWSGPHLKISNMKISLQWSEERILKKILQYLAVQPSEKAFYSNLKFISSIQNGCLHINSQSCQTHKFKTEISVKCANCLVHVWVLVP